MQTFLPLSGFLGAGKTTTMLALVGEMERAGRTVAVVTNDQAADLVDTQLARAVTNRVAEVSGGCFCCRFEDLWRVVSTLFDDGVDTVLAEAVGSCTDLRATVVRPLRRYHGSQLTVGALTAVVDPHRYGLFARAWDTGAESDLAYLYSHQLAEADVIAVNKVDTLSTQQCAELVADLRRRFTRARVVSYSALSGDVSSLAAVVEHPAQEPGEDAELDYDRYAAAEAELAWLNGTYAVSSDTGFEPARWITATLESVAESCRGTQALVGHAKIAVDTPAGLAKGSLTDADRPVWIDVSGPRLARTATVTLNLRIALPPAALDDTAARAVRAADVLSGTRSEPDPTAAVAAGAFAPSYPRPTHRIAATD